MEPTDGDDERRLMGLAKAELGVQVFATVWLFEILQQHFDGDCFGELLKTVLTEQVIIMFALNCVGLDVLNIDASHLDGFFRKGMPKVLLIPCGYVIEIRIGCHESPH